MATGTERQLDRPQRTLLPELGWLRADPLHARLVGKPHRRPILQVRMLKLRCSATCPRPRGRAGTRSGKGLGSGVKDFSGLPEVPGPAGRGLGQSKFNWWGESWQPGGGEGEGNSLLRLRWLERLRRARSGKLLYGHTGFLYPTERTCSVSGHLALSQAWKLRGVGVGGHVLCFSEMLAAPHTLVLNTPSAEPPLALVGALPSRSHNPQ